MNDDELRSRLTRMDPQATAPVDPITSPRAQNLLERTMTTNPMTTNPSPTDHPDRDAAPTGRRRFVVALGAAAAVAAIAIGAGVLAARGGGSPALPTAKSTLALSLQPSDAMASCPMFDAARLKTFPVAFAGTVTAVQGDTVILDVTTWFVGGTAQVVTLSSPTAAAQDGTAFTLGKDYLVSAAEGVVTTCGYSGEDDDVLRQAYTAAFPG